MVHRGLVLVVLAAAAATAATSSSAWPGGTVVHYYHAFKEGKISPGVHLTRTARGYCWETSNVESRRYAWRCFRGNSIHDPCFSSSGHGRFVICPVEPWSSDAIRLRLTRGLPPWRHYRYRQSLPVGVWTSSGRRCVHSSGATSRIRGLPITYECSNGGVLAGFADRSAPTWTIRYAPSFGARHLTRVGIADAWW